ncbi:MAG: zf-HC2 domain-containing protein [Gemmataceae bacterium]
MMRCHDCRNLLLDRAYGLLDEAENAAIDAHLAGCPACAAAASGADREQTLLAAAAKSSFPNVSFAPPVEEPAVPFTPRRQAKSSWVQWVVAASVLAMIPGTLIPAGKLADRYRAAREGVDDSVARTAKAATEYQRQLVDAKLHDPVAAAEKKHLAVVSGWVNDAKTEASRKVTVDVTKPHSVMPGAPNEYVIAIRDPAHSLEGSTVEAQFRDEAGKVLHAQPMPAKSATVKLPAEVWKRVAPQSDLVLSVSAVNAAGARTELLEPIRLYGPVYSTMLTTDKTAYRPGEQIHFRSLTLDRITLRPPVREQNLRFVLRKSDGTGTVFERSGTTNLVKDAAGELVPMTDANGQPIRGVGCGSFLLPADLPEGEYILTLTELAGAGGLAPAIAAPVTKTIRVHKGGPEKFTKKLRFHSPSYTSGQPVIATAELKLGDKPVVGAKGRILLTSNKEEGPFIITPKPQARKPDGNLLLEHGLTDENGRFRIEFNLPVGSDIKLMVTFDELGGGESVFERVPVAGTEMKVEFFPEGGPLLAGVPNRVYVRGTNAAGKPIDVRGTIVSGNEIIAKVEAPGADEEPGVHRGVGSFTFTPKADVKYQLRLLNANMAAALPELPPAVKSGVTFTALDTVAKPGQPIRVRVHSVGKDRNLVVGAYTRGRLADTQTVQVKADAPAVVSLLAKPDSRGGVTRVTVFEEAGSDLVPVAERLVFRKPGEVMNLTATPAVNDRAVDLSVTATDETGHPVPAILWAAAVNAAVAPDAKHRSLPTHFLLGGEVQSPDELEHADFLLTDHPKAAEAIDHVLATQGWRRFVEQGRPVPPGSAAEALLHAHGNRKVKHTPSLVEKYWSQFEASAKDVDEARQKQEAFVPVLLQLYAEFESNRRATEDHATAVQAAAEPYDRIRDRLSLATGCVAVLCVMLGLLAAARGIGWAPYAVGAVAAAGMAIHFTLDASRNPAIVPEVNIGRLVAPKPTPRPIDPDVKLREPKNNGSVEGQKYTLFGLDKQKLFPARGPAPSNMKATIPAELPKLTFRTAPGQTVLDALLAAEKKLEAKADSVAKERALAALKKLEAALLAGGTASDPAAEKLRDAAHHIRPFVVREYAPSAPIADEADTIFWNPVIVLPTDGRTTLKFQLGTAPGGYQVYVAGHSPDGRLGATKLLLPGK